MKIPRHISKLPLKKLAAFVLAGSIAFAVDALTLLGLTACGMPPLLARILSISCAMVVAWLLNRRLTFQLTTKPTWREFARYAALAWVVATINYLIFAALLATGLISHPVLATAIATLCAMLISFTGMQKHVFRVR